MKKITTLSMAALLALSCLPIVACKDQGETPPPEADYVSLANFEQWGPDFQMLRLFNNFGKVTRNEDKNYIKEGEFSAHLQPVGSTIKKASPILCLPTKSTFFEYDYQDFTKYESVSAYLLNASEKPIDVKIGLVSSIASANTIQTMDGDSFTLQPNTWQRIDYWLEHSILNLSSDITQIEGVYLEFPNQGIMYPEDAPDIYLDDVRLSKSSDVEMKDLVDLETKETEGKKVWEICDFEKPYQRYVFRTEINGPPQENIECSVVKAADYGIEATSGNNVLKVTRHSSTERAFIYMSEQIMQKMGMKDIPESEYKTTYLCFDVYRDRKGDGTDRYCSFRFSKSGGKGMAGPQMIARTDTQYTNIAKGAWYKWGYSHYFDNNKWSTFRVSLYELNHIGEDYVKNPGPMQIWMNAFKGTADENWFFDNFRMETGEKLFVLGEAN